MGWNPFTKVHLYSALPLSNTTESSEKWRSPRNGTVTSRLNRVVCKFVIILTSVTIIIAGFSLIAIRHSTTRAVTEAKAKAAAEKPRWEDFTLLEGYYSGLGRLVRGNRLECPPVGSTVAAGSVEALEDVKSIVFNPYPDFKSKEYRSTWRGEYKECSYGVDLSGKQRPRPEVRTFEGIPEGMPTAVFGSHALLGLNNDLCFDRYGRYGTYGYGYSKGNGGLGVAEYGNNTAGNETGWGRGSMLIKEIDWRGVDWGKLQRECVGKNKDRFSTPDPEDLDPEGILAESTHSSSKRSGKSDGKKPRPRAAILLRTWAGYEYKPSDMASIRSLISELSINSGGEFSVYLLVHVKNNELPIWASKKLYEKTLQESVPEEFWGIAELWSESMMGVIYNNLKDNTFRGVQLKGVYRSSFFPVQDFAYRHPEFDFVWNWEMDVRYIGHFYELFSGMDSWAAKQPRKHLWERNERYYIPSVHGSWANFSSAVAAKSPKSVWGPVPVENVTIFPTDPKPPFLTLEEDIQSTWGVDEPADLISLNPIFDPEGATWVHSGDSTGYGFPIEDTSPKGPPRRTSIVAVDRLSRKLLMRMHAENALHGHAMCSEMWPPSVALQHGLKAVFAPHPLFVDRAWPLKYLERTFNGGPKGSAGGRGSVFGKGEHNFRGTSWYYNAQFASKLWKRWVGVEVDGVGGEIFESVQGRMCLRSMLLHPIKSMEV
ncbi:hypothetical protein L873DRAFT_1689983 [Choiromyces venosus 120613-1]|uniref:Uncharacterized protein n=1 Tax=Choiromyces venosus 120613-1 TaxID=1336337 RepID=A0A3N4JH95_9PEZI|nr:hypothetical protein L873DRAFT_1689983 [Choiromyces venosus 120613-1]